MQVMILLQQSAAPAVHESANKFAELDPIGIGMTMIAMTVVFLSLMLLYLVFKNIARMYNLDMKNKFRRKQGLEPAFDEAAEDPTGELGAAVALALYYYQNELHDHENTLLTIKKVSRTYSPWSSKIYGLRRSPK
jgi:glutaconyl-CoA/methylmalonyl-CoA decarboxylase subunit delta